MSVRLFGATIIFGGDGAKKRMVCPVGNDAYGDNPINKKDFLSLSTAMALKGFVPVNSNKREEGLPKAA